MPPKRRKSQSDPPPAKKKTVRTTRKKQRVSDPEKVTPTTDDSSTDDESGEGSSKDPAASDIGALLFILSNDKNGDILTLDPENAIISDTGRRKRAPTPTIKLDKANPIKIKIRAAQKEVDDYNKLHFADADSTLPLRDQILLSSCDLSTKSMVLKKFDDNEKSKNSYDQAKFLNWTRDVTRLPFGKQKPLPITLEDGSEKIQGYLTQVKEQLDRAVAGHDHAKAELVDFIARIISNPDGKGNILALVGPPGVGKTRMVRRGVADALGRPFHVINLGGMNDVHVLSGHDMTYTGSRYGKIAQILIQSQCMNPVIYLDELDKIQSSSEKAMEIFRILTHILDEEQNHEFYDEYFNPVRLDLSKILFVASLNNLDDVETILRDRLKVIRIKALDTPLKVKIVQDYVLPELCSMVKMPRETIDLSDDVIRYLINNKTPKEEGCRQLKRKIETIIQKLNTMRITATGLFGSERQKVTLTVQVVDDLLKETEEDDKMDYHNMYN